MVICIAGKNRIAVRAVNFLSENYSTYTITGCKNRSDNGIDGWQPSFSRYCEQRRIPLVNLEELHSVHDLLFISLEYDRIIRPGRFASNRLFNIHFSKLPAYKGMYTSAIPLLHGEKESGVTLHQIDSGIDTGSILMQRTFSLRDDLNARDLYQMYLQEGYELFKDSIATLITGEVQVRPQPASDSSYYGKDAIDYSNLRIDLNKTAQQIHNQIRAFTFREYQLPVVLGYQIYRSEITDTRSAGKIGSIVRQDKASIMLNTIDYQIRLYCDRQEELVRAAESGDIDLFRDLKECGYPVKTRTNRGWDAFIIGCYHNHGKFIYELLNDGWDVNSSNYQGTTAVMYALSAAVRDGDADALKVLYQWKPDLKLSDRYGKNVLDYARDHGMSDIFRMLETNSRAQR